jgi:8-amino-7-oxononanoate synthase
MLLPSIQRTLRQLCQRHQRRSRYVVQNRQDHQLTVDGHTVIDFCSNDYLQLATHEHIKKAWIKAIDQYGLGSSASALVSGYSRAHQMLEETFAEFTHCDAALLFNSGYHANLGAITTLAHRNSTIIADKYVHASLIDGIRLSRSRYYRYRHSDLRHADTLLKQATHPLLITESIFSIQGDLTDLKAMADLAERHQATLLVDDAHGVGILGTKGRGSRDHFHLTTNQVHCVVTPLGKALGSMGALVTGHRDMIDALVQLARPYRYSTALPPALCDATRIAIQIMQQESWRRDQLHHLIHRFIQGAIARQLPLLSTDQTPIKSILMGSSERALAAQQTLWQQGFLTACIRPPTVPVQAACIRISLHCMHSEAIIDQLLDRLKDYCDHLSCMKK